MGHLRILGAIFFRIDCGYAAMLVALLGACPSSTRPLTWTESCVLTQRASCSFTRRCLGGTWLFWWKCQHPVASFCKAVGEERPFKPRPPRYTRAAAERCAAAMADFQCSAVGPGDDLIDVVPECEPLREATIPRRHYDISLVAPEPVDGGPHGK